MWSYYKLIKSLVFTLCTFVKVQVLSLAHCFQHFSLFFPSHLLKYYIIAVTHSVVSFYGFIDLNVSICVL